MKMRTHLSLVEVGEMLVGVLLGVDATHRGTKAVGHDLTDGRDAGVHVVDEEPPVLVVLRPVAVQLDRDLGDEAQRTLVADDDVPDIGPDGPAGHVLDPTDRAVGEHRLEPDDHVLDAAVERRQLPGRTRGGEAAHLG